MVKEKGGVREKKNGDANQSGPWNIKLSENMQTAMEDKLACKKGEQSSTWEKSKHNKVSKIVSKPQVQKGSKMVGPPQRRAPGGPLG